MVVGGATGPGARSEVGDAAGSGGRTVVARVRARGADGTLRPVPAGAAFGLSSAWVRVASRAGTVRLTRVVTPTEAATCRAILTAEARTAQERPAVAGGVVQAWGGGVRVDRAGRGPRVDWWLGTTPEGSATVAVLRAPAGLRTPRRRWVVVRTTLRGTPRANRERCAGRVATERPALLAATRSLRVVDADR